jgi:hypothetical protein
VDSAAPIQDPVVGSCEHGNEPLCPAKGSVFVDQLRD